MERKTTYITKEQTDRQMALCAEISAFWQSQDITPLAYVETYGCQ